MGWGEEGSYLGERSTSGEATKGVCAKGDMP